MYNIIRLWWNHSVLQTITQSLCFSEILNVNSGEVGEVINFCFFVLRRKILLGFATCMLKTDRFLFLCRRWKMFTVVLLWFPFWFWLRILDKIFTSSVDKQTMLSICVNITYRINDSFHIFSPEKHRIFLLWFPNYNIANVAISSL